jgi:hypothetical protein
MAAEKTGYFAKNFSQTKEEAKISKQPLIEKKLKRNFEAAFDSAQSQKIDAQAKIEDLRANIDNFNIQSIIDQVEVVDAADRTMALIKLEYAAAFDTQIPRD